MKKVLGIIAVTAMVASSAFAQGTLVFASSASLVRTENGTAMAAGVGQVQFGWATVGTPFVPWTPALTAEQWIAANPGWTVFGAPANVGSPLAGRFSGGTLTAGVAPQPTFPAGAVIQGIVVGWTGTAADFLAGYAGALAQGASGQFGVSSVFTVDTGDPVSVPPGTPGNIYNSTATPFTGLTLQTIPEPSSFALAGLGAAALLIFRRRK
jgi:hypothetical protein